MYNVLIRLHKDINYFFNSIAYVTTMSDNAHVIFNLQSLL